MARAKVHGAAVVFALHNFAYQDATFFRAADALLVPSQFTRAFYEQNLGLECTAIPCPMNWTRVCCAQIERRYVTFVNPQLEKGVFIFARIAAESALRRPEIPVLVVQARGNAGWLDRTGIDLRSLRNVYVMANTPDPRHFFRISRLLLMPSLWNESFGRVAAEAMINGIPVLASDRGVCPRRFSGPDFCSPCPVSIHLKRAWSQVRKKWIIGWRP